jgi:hypothetical protein
MTLSYQSAGTGEPLVLLHGMGSASTIWKQIMPQLTERFRVIAFDLPGHGNSSYDPNQNMDPHSLAVLIKDELTKLEIDKAHFVGNSLGGWIAMDFAATYPEHTLSVVGLAPAGLWLVPTMQRTALGAKSRLIARFVYPFADQLLKESWARKFAFGLVSPEWRTLPRETLVDAVVAYGSSSGYFPAWDGMLKRRFDKPISKTVPITIIFGDSDNTLPAQTSQERTLAPEHARWVMLTRSGHAPMWDRPTEVISEIFLTTDNVL